jgi:hypothetical protein
MLELPGWAWVLVAWCLASFCLAAGLARWFRFMRDDGRDWDG